MSRTVCRYCGIGVPGDYPVCDAYACSTEENNEDAEHFEREGETYLVHEAHVVRDEGTIVVFEGIITDEDGDPQAIWFGVDRRTAAGAAQAAAEGQALSVEGWSVLGRTEVV